MRVNKKLFTHLIVSFGLIGGLFSTLGQTASAACAAQDTSRGTATATINVTTAGTYRVWSRISPDETTSTNNSYILEVDGVNCGIVVGDNNSIPAGRDANGNLIWTWVNYRDGNTASPIDLNLTAGTHTVVMIGREDNVHLDRLLFLSDLSCIPDNATKGDNCANVDTTPPVASITSPANGTTVSSGSTSVVASATDNVGVTKLDLYVDNTLKNTVNASSMNYTLNTSTLTNGSHTLKVIATDAAGNASTPVTSTINVSNTVPDTTAPTVTLTAPANGTTISGNANLTATANDNVGVTKVEFYVDNNLMNTDTTSPYAYTLNTTVLTNASHTIKAISYDAAGNASTPSSVTVTVNNATPPPPDTTAPTVSITAPANNATVSGTVSLTAIANDNVGVTRVEFSVDGTLVNTDSASPYSYSLNTVTLTNGTHALQAKAFDLAGNSSTQASVTVTVSNVSLKAGDVNGDGKVNLTDLTIIGINWNKSGQTRGQGDLNGDGKVNLTDLTLLAINWGK